MILSYHVKGTDAQNLFLSIYVFVLSLNPLTLELKIYKIIRTCCLVSNPCTVESTLEKVHWKAVQGKPDCECLEAVLLYRLTAMMLLKDYEEN